MTNQNTEPLLGQSSPALHRARAGNFVTTRERGYTEAEALRRFDELRAEGFTGGFDLSVFEDRKGWTVCYTTRKEDSA